MEFAGGVADDEICFRCDCLLVFGEEGPELGQSHSFFWIDLTEIYYCASEDLGILVVQNQFGKSIIQTQVIKFEGLAVVQTLVIHQID